MDAASIAWISTEPPLFRATHHRYGLDGYDETVIFEGCEVSETWQHATLVAGPQQLVAMYTQGRASIRHRGRELGALPGARFIRFQP